MATVTFQLFADSSSHGGSVETRAVRAESHELLIESAAPSGSSRLQSSVDFIRSRN